MYQFLYRYSPPGNINPKLLTRAPGALRCAADPVNDVHCDPNKSACLFDVDRDPCEYNNIADLHPEVVSFLMEKLNVYNASALPSFSLPPDPMSKPSLNGGFVQPWL